jgi:hypothetical protein
MPHTEYANKEMTINSDSQLNDADLELLSAYIDRQLGDSERAALERRLSQEPVLRGVLDELRATVGLLHDLEPLRPPRSFMLAAPATAPRRFWSFQWPAIASALVALVCLLTFSYALIRSSGGGSTASAPVAAPAPAAMQEAAAPTAAAAGAAAPDSAMRQSPAVTAAPAAAAPTAAPAAEASTAAPAAAAPMTAAEASTPTPAPTIMASGGAGAIATAQPAAEAQPAADSAAPTAAAPPADVAPKATPVPALQPYNALVATSEISSPGTVTLEQPPAPAANSAPSGGSRNLWLIAGVVVLVLLIAAGIGLALRRRARE